MKLKFSTTNGVREVKNDQKMAMRCYLLAMKHNSVEGQVLPIDFLDVRDENKEQRGKLTDELVPIPLDDINSEKVTYLDFRLKEEIKEKFVKFMRNNKDA